MLLDEWQRFSAVWDTARREIDRRSKPGQFLLTASAALSDPKKVFHSGAGRISRLRMRPMTLWESGESNGTVSLRALFEGEREVAAVSDLSPEDLAFALCCGGWPEVVERKDDKALEYAREYLEESVRSDLFLFDGVRRNPERLRRLLCLLARNLGRATSNAALLRVWKNESPTAPGEVTLRSNLRALEGVFLTEELPAWLSALHGRTALRTSALRHLRIRRLPPRPSASAPTNFCAAPKSSARSFGISPCGTCASMPTLWMRRSISTATKTDSPATPSSSAATAASPSSTYASAVSKKQTTQPRNSSGSPAKSIPSVCPSPPSAWSSRRPADTPTVRPTASSSCRSVAFGPERSTDFEAPGRSKKRAAGRHSHGEAPAFSVESSDGFR